MGEFEGVSEDVCGGRGVVVSYLIDLIRQVLNKYKRE